MQLKLKKLGLLLIELILAGTFLGLLVSLFQFLAHLIIENSQKLLENSTDMVFALVIIVSAIYFLMVVLLNRRVKGYTGSGIPQLEAYHDGWLNFNPFIMLGLIFFNSLSAFYGGFMLGGEGPSVTIGGSLGMIFNRVTKKEDKELVAAMSSAGFGVALMAPVAGFFHLIEENKKVLSFSLLFKGLIIMSISFTISYFLYRHSIFNIEVNETLAALYYLYIPVFIIFGILMGKLFQISLVKLKDVFNRYKFLDYLTPIIAVLFMVLRRYYPYFSLSGAGLVTLSLLDSSIGILVLILLWRIFGTSLSLSAKVSGGLTLPTLAFGFLAGGILVSLISLADPNILSYKGIFMIISMIIVFATVCNTPLAGLFIGLGMGSIKGLALPLTLATIIYMVVDKLFFNFKSIYKDLEKRLPGYKEAHDGTI